MLVAAETCMRFCGLQGVINRSQHDLNTGLSMSVARDAEADFFASVPEYADVSLATFSSTNRLMARTLAFHSCLSSTSAISPFHTRSAGFSALDQTQPAAERT